MSWRTVVISRRAKLDYKMGYMAVRNEEGVQNVFLDEIHTLLIESTGVSLTAALLSELMKCKIKVIFCDEKHNPSSELIPYYGSHDTSAKIRNQLAWDETIKKEVWKAIVKDKIFQQKEVLLERGLSQSELLKEYIDEVEFGDESNREGHAAKVYFNAVFGKSFSRSDENGINAALNYGYSILLSTFNKEIVSLGYITQIGIFHNNMFNHFNLGSDLMETFRILVDRKVLSLEPNELTKEVKYALLDILNDYVIFDGQRTLVQVAMKRYCKNVMDALDNRDVSMLRFYRYEL